MCENSTFKFFSLLSLSFLATPSPYLSLALTGIIIIHECRTQPSVKSRATFAPFPSPAGRVHINLNPPTHGETSKQPYPKTMAFYFPHTFFIFCIKCFTFRLTSAPLLSSLPLSLSFLTVSVHRFSLFLSLHKK